MDRATAVELHRRSLMSFTRLMGSSGESARVFDRDGVVAAVVPAVPDRSVVNSVGYRDAEALSAALDDLAAAYEEAGVSAWTVWVPEEDGDAITRLEAAGHRLDAEPTAMVAELANLHDPDPAEFDWDAAANTQDVALINDRAYGWPEGTFGGAMERFGHIDGLRLYQARVDGEPACVLGAYDHGSDCEVYFVATLAEHRGKGLARRLMHRALLDARERGLTTSNLQSTKKGYPVYERLGYEPICKLEMWERRK
jgi:GNAT superfamily N-acetyltransferase